MADKQGFIKLYRKLQDHWLWQDKPFSKGQAWIDLILMANYKDGSVIFDNGKIEVKAGSFVTSLRKLADRWGWSISKVSRFLFLLENEKMLIQNRDTKKTVITLENYDVFQGKKTANGTPKEHQRDTGVTQTKTNKNNKEYIKNKKEGGCAANCPSGEDEDTFPYDEGNLTDAYYAERGI